nr:hypothetical protein [Gammaproteobacteria bacterium]
MMRISILVGNHVIAGGLEDAGLAAKLDINSIRDGCVQRSEIHKGDMLAIREEEEEDKMIIIREEEEEEEEED